MTTHAQEAYEAVLATVGATQPKRDTVDSRIIAGVRGGSGRQPVELPNDAWPLLTSAAAAPDRDGDGLPDAWEQTHGLNPDDANDAARVGSPEGWTQLELWLNNQ
jgi:hypothetical protein